MHYFNGSFTSWWRLASLSLFMPKVAKKKSRYREKFLQETVEHSEEDAPRSPTAQSGPKSPKAARKDVTSRKKRQPPPAIVGGLDKFFNYISEVGVAGIRKLYNETLSVYRAPDNLYKYAEFEKNRDKNRYLDVVCLDHSRVVLTLDVPPSTNYIHANWVRFDKHDKAFIATQAPLENTREDFWRMIFQEQCSSVINLTSEIDDTDRMVHYFPAKPGDFINYGKMFVNTKKIEDENKFLVYTIEVLPDGCSNSHLLNLIKPKDDSGKPSTTMILRMLRIVASSEKISNGPVVVHCVSGVGRAGTVILIDVILRRLFTNQLPVDLAEIFRLLRNQRASCLQREAQFMFVVASVVDYIGTRYPGRYRQKRDKFKEDFKITLAAGAAKKASREIVKPENIDIVPKTS